MAAFRFSPYAEADLLSIGEYSLRTWGLAQTVRYIDELEACCQRLADNPASGRACDHVRVGLRRTEQGEHVVFFDVSREAFSFPASCMNACCPNDKRSTTQTKNELGIFERIVVGLKD